MAIIGPRPALWNQDDLIEERDKYGANDIKPVCLKNTGPLLSHFIAIAIISMGNAKNIIPKNESVKSINRLKKCLYNVQSP